METTLPGRVAATSCRFVSGWRTGNDSKLHGQIPAPDAVLTPLGATPGAQIVDHDCRKPAGARGSYEYSRDYGLVLIRRGGYWREVNGRGASVGPTDAFFERPFVEQRIEHHRTPAIGAPRCGCRRTPSARWPATHRARRADHDHARHRPPPPRAGRRAAARNRSVRARRAARPARRRARRTRRPGTLHGPSLDPGPTTVASSSGARSDRRGPCGGGLRGTSPDRSAIAASMSAASSRALPG